MTAKISFPCLICVDKDIYQPRLPSYVRKKETASRKIKVMTLDELSDRDEKKYGLSGSPTQVRKIFPPENNIEHEILRGTPDELADGAVKKLSELKLI